MTPKKANTMAFLLACITIPGGVALGGYFGGTALTIFLAAVLSCLIWVGEVEVFARIVVIEKEVQQE